MLGLKLNHVSKRGHCGLLQGYLTGTDEITSAHCKKDTTLKDMGEEVIIFNQTDKKYYKIQQ